MRRFWKLALLVWTCWSAPGIAADNKPPVTVFAAASLTEILQAAGRAHAARTGVRVRFSFASSATIARQLEAGAPADLFLSADGEWMDYASSHRLILPASRAIVARGRLVLIAPAGTATGLRIGRSMPLAAALGPQGRLALGDPESVPAGRYARAALIWLGAWSNVADHLARAENVRAALALVARGDAPLGIVYETDARAEPRVRIVGAFPEASHPPILYPAALTPRAGPGAASFLAFLRSSAGQAIFRRFGFLPAR